MSKGARYDWNPCVYAIVFHTLYTFNVTLFFVNMLFRYCTVTTFHNIYIFCYAAFIYYNLHRRNIVYRLSFKMIFSVIFCWSIMSCFIIPSRDSFPCVSFCVIIFGGTVLCESS